MVIDSLGDVTIPVSEKLFYIYSGSKKVNITLFVVIRLT